MNNAVVNLHQYKNLQKDNNKLIEEISKLKKLQGSREMALIVQKLKQQVKEKDDTISKQQQEINDISAAHNKADAELATLQAEYDKLRQEHIAQKHELNTAKDNIYALTDDNNKAQAMIKALVTTVQSKENSYDDLSTAHTNLQTWFDALKNSMDTLDKQQLIRTAVKATGEAMQYKADLTKSNKLLKEMVGSQYQFQHKMDTCDVIVKVLLLHAHNLISGKDPHHGMELEAAQALLKVLGYQKVTDGKPIQMHTMPGTQEGWDWLLQPGLQPQLEERFQQLCRTSTDATATTEESKPAALSRFTDDQAACFHVVLQSDTPELALPTLMDSTKPHKSHIHEMYEQSFHATEEDMGPMFVDNLDEKQTPVKTTPSADKIEARCHQLEALTIPGFSQKLFADTVS